MHDQQTRTSGGCPVEGLADGERLVRAADGAIEYRERRVYAERGDGEALNTIEWPVGWRLRIRAVPQQMARFGEDPRDLPYVVVDNRTTFVRMRLAPELACNAGEAQFIRDCIALVDPAVAGRYHATVTIDDRRLFLMPVLEGDSAGYRSAVGGVVYRFARSYVLDAWRIEAVTKLRVPAPAAPVMARPPLPRVQSAVPRGGPRIAGLSFLSDVQTAGTAGATTVVPRRAVTYSGYSGPLGGQIGTGLLGPEAREYIEQRQRAGETRRRRESSERLRAIRASADTVAERNRAAIASALGRAAVPIWYAIGAEPGTATWIDVRRAAEQPDYVRSDGEVFTVPGLIGDAAQAPRSDDDPDYAPIEWTLSAENIADMRRAYTEVARRDAPYLPDEAWEVAMSIEGRSRSPSPQRAPTTLDGGSPDASVAIVGETPMDVTTAASIMSDMGQTATRKRVHFGEPHATTMRTAHPSRALPSSSLPSEAISLPENEDIEFEFVLAAQPGETPEQAKATQKRLRRAQRDLRRAERKQKKTEREQRKAVGMQEVPSEANTATPTSAKRRRRTQSSTSSSSSSRTSIPVTGTEASLRGQDTRHGPETSEEEAGTGEDVFTAPEGLSASKIRNITKDRNYRASHDPRLAEINEQFTKVHGLSALPRVRAISVGGEKNLLPQQPWVLWGQDTGNEKATFEQLLAQDVATRQRYVRLYDAMRARLISDGTGSARDVDPALARKLRQLEADNASSVRVAKRPRTELPLPPPRSVSSSLVSRPSTTTTTATQTTSATPFLRASGTGAGTPMLTTSTSRAAATSKIRQAIKSAQGSSG